MGRWRNLRSKYKRVLGNEKLKSGSASKPKAREAAWLIRKMEFLKENDDHEPTDSSFNPKPEVQNLFDDTAQEILEGDICSIDDIQVDVGPSKSTTTTSQTPIKKRKRDRDDENFISVVRELNSTISNNNEKLAVYMAEKKNEKERKLAQIEKKNEEAKKSLVLQFIEKSESRITELSLLTQVQMIFEFSQIIEKHCK